jgi:hypothetical protein
MPKQAIRLGIAVFILLLSLGLLSVQAEPVTQQTQVQITTPEMNAELRGVVAIIGSASVPNFQFYKIEFGVGPNPAQWASVGALHDKPVLNSQLEVWDTTRLPDGVYTLRLQAVKKDGNYEEFYVRQVTLANSRAQTTPTPTNTPAMLATSVLPTTVITPKATATLRIIAPTAALAVPTVTPTPNRPVQQRGETLPLDPKGWSQAFLFGAAAMGAVFVLLGIVFGLRRLL